MKVYDVELFSWDLQASLYTGGSRELAMYDQIVPICGQYEGVDYRVEEHLVDETISIGRLCINWWRVASYRL